MHLELSEICFTFTDSLVPKHREQDKALSKAIESSDTDVVYLVVFHIFLKVDAEKVNLLCPHNTSFVWRRVIF
jgi:hypothetical protein